MSWSSQLDSLGTTLTVSGWIKPGGQNQWGREGPVLTQPLQQAAVFTGCFDWQVPCSYFVLSQLNQGSAENNYNDYCRGQWDAQTVTQCPGWGGSTSWYQGNTQLRTYRHSLQTCLHKFNSVRYIYKNIIADSTDSAFWASSVQCLYQDGGKAVQPPQMSGLT